MRQDRHMSSLVFACHSNQLDCLKMLYEHGRSNSNDNQQQFVQMWIGGDSEQRDCLFYAVRHDNADMLSYLLSDIKLGARVNDQKITSELD